MGHQSTFGQHVVYATLPVLKICLLGSVGAVLAHTGVLDPAGRRVLSRLIFVVFTPCLTFTKLAPVLTARHLLQWSPLALNLFLNVAVGLALGALLLAVVRPPLGLRRHVVAACGLGNAGNLPLVLVTALVQESGGALFGGEPAISEGLAIAYVAVGIWAATITHFSIGTHLLKLPEGESSSSSSEATGSGSSGALLATGSCTVELGPLLPARTQQQQQQQQQQVEQRHSLTSGSRDSLASSSSADCIVLAGAGGSAACSHCGALSCHGDEQAAWRCSACGNCNDAALKAQSLEQQHWQEGSGGRRLGGSEQARLLGNSSGGSGQEQQHQAQHMGSSSRSRLAAVGGVAWELLSAFTSPPMIGCVLAVAVGMLRPLRDALFEPGGSLLMLQDCIDMFGACCIPSLLLMLGATLSKGPGEAKVPARVVLGVAAVRLVVLPLLGTAWLVAAKAAGWLAAPDRWFLLIMLIQGAVPTALNVHTLATLYSNREAEMAAMLFWQYIAACVTLPAALSGYLWLLNQPLMAA